MIIYRCPITFVKDYMWDYILAYSLFEKGILPNGNSWLNESQKFLDAMLIIKNEISKREQKNG